MKLFIVSMAFALSGYAGINTWIPLGPYGGSVATVAVDPRNPGTLYVATGTLIGDGGRIYKTGDGGTSWALLDFPFGAASIAIDPQNTDTIYVGVRGPSVPLVFKSTDGGATFSNANSGLEGFQFYGDLTVDPVHSGTVYAAMIFHLMDPCRQNSGCYSVAVFKTTDGGASWSWASAGLPPIDSLITALAINPKDPNIVYAGSPRNGVFKSNDGAASWSQINLSVAVCCTYIGQGLVIDPLNQDTIYAANFGNIVKLSSDGTILSTVPLDGNIVSLANDPQNTRTLYAGAGSNIFKSIDAGVSWTTTAYGAQGYGNFYSLAVDPLNSGTVYVGSTTGYGVLRTTDGGSSWGSTGSELRAFDLTSVTVDPHDSGTLYALSTFPQGVFKTTNGGRNWTAVRGIERAQSLLIDPRDSNTLYAVNVNRDFGRLQILKSIDGGASWNDIGPRGFAAINSGFPGPLILDPGNPDTLYMLALPPGPPSCCTTFIFKTTDGGMSWSMRALSEANLVTLLSIDPQNSSTLYAGGAYNAVISKSTNGGITWSESPLPPEAFPVGDDDFWVIVTSIVVDPQNSNVVYVTGSGGIFKSTDGGTTWTTINSGLVPHTCIGSNSCYAPYSVVSLVIDPQKSILYASLKSIYNVQLASILWSTDGGVSWSRIDGGLKVLSANSLALDPSNPSTLYAASSGVYRITFVPEIQ